jgi:ParB family chromosome partitioning protein
MPAIEQTTQTIATHSETGNAAGDPQPAAMVAVALLGEHPGNVRTDLELTAEFCASVAETGVRVPLLVTTTDAGEFRVIEGHRRLAAAVKTGLAAVPCVLDSARASDEAGQYLDMVVANSASHRRNFTPIEEAAALFAAHEAGATRTRIRKSTGRKADEVKTALQAGRISAAARERAGDLANQLSLDQLALLAEFDGDDDASAKILDALTHGYTVEYVAERIRQERAEAAEHQRLLGELEAAGIPVTDGLPEGAERLASLDQDGAELTPEAHAACPGRGAYFLSWSPTDPMYYCSSPAEYGHTARYATLTSTGGGSGTASASPLPDDPDGSNETPDAGIDPSRRLVIEGNRAWAAAAEVRKRWLGQLLARRAAPKEAARFVATLLLTMPEPLRLGLSGAHGTPLFDQIAGHTDHALRESVATCPAARLPLLMLAPIAVAYESEMYGADAGRRSTWRQDRYSPCSRTEAGGYLAFLASLGYQLSPIEQAVVSGEPYTGDPLGDTLVDEPAEDPDSTGTSEAGTPADPGETSVGDGTAGTSDAAADSAPSAQTEGTAHGG